MSSAEISEKLDYYGAILNQNIDRDFAVLSLVTLNKHIENTLPVVEDIIKNPSFPEKELSIWIHGRKYFNNGYGVIFAYF